MTKEELKQEAEEIANKRCHEIMCFGHCSFSNPKHHRCGEWHREYECALKGAEYGYNKANEWHYVKDGDLPKTGKPCLVYLVNDCAIVARLREDNVWTTDGHNAFENVIAWKEIVLPELKETK